MYSGYDTQGLKSQLKRVHRAINDNRREIRRLIHRLNELTEAVKENNKFKKSLKRELKARKQNGEPDPIGR